MPYTKEQLDKMFASLPEDIREAMTSVDTTTVLNEIREKYKLHIDQIGQLSADISLLMVGSITPQRFLSKLEGLSGVSKEMAGTIAAEINEKIFKTVRNTLKDIHYTEIATENENAEKPKNSDPKTPTGDPYREAI